MEVASKPTVAPPALFLAPVTKNIPLTVQVCQRSAHEVKLYLVSGLGVPMGYIRVKATIISPENVSMKTEVDLLADTGAVFTLISKQRLANLGIKPVEKMVFTSISGEKILRDVGAAYLQVQDRKWLTSIIFGEEKDTEILGVTTLEQLGLQVDPIGMKIKPLPLYLL